MDVQLLPGVFKPIMRCFKPSIVVTSKKCFVSDCDFISTASNTVLKNDKSCNRK